MSRQAPPRTQVARLGRVIRRLASVSPAAAGRLTTRAWFTPPRSRVNPSWDVGMREAHPFAVGSGNRPVLGARKGHGPTVLLVHGWGGNVAQFGAIVPELVERNMEAAWFDLPAHGSDGRRTTDLLEIADTLTAIAERVGAEALLAHSAGAASAMLALDQGLPARAVVLIAPAVRLDHYVSRFGEMLQLTPDITQQLRRRIESRFGEGVWEEMRGDRIASRLDIPTLVVHDRLDREGPLAASSSLVADWQSAGLLTTEGLGHTRILGDHTVTRSIADFLARELT